MHAPVEVEDGNWQDNIGLYSTTDYLTSKEIELTEKTQNNGKYAVQFLSFSFELCIHVISCATGFR